MPGKTPLPLPPLSRHHDLLSSVLSSAVLSLIRPSSITMCQLAAAAALDMPYDL